MKYEVKPVGVCSKKVSFEINDNKVSNVSFVGGCNGNLKAISSLVEGMRVEDIKDRLLGIKCGMRPTSCSDQFAQAVLMAVKGDIPATEER